MMGARIKEPLLLLLLLVLGVAVLSKRSSVGQDDVLQFVKHTGNVHISELEHMSALSGLHNLSAKIVEAQETCQLNITWIITTNASIRDLTATKICVSGHSRCVWPRYNYTEKLQSQTMLGEHSWHFYYVGFPVEENTEYSIKVSSRLANLKNRLLSEFPLSSPDCNDEELKYCNICQEKGSLWDPDITVCKTETELEVNFTPNSLVPKYRINICETEICQKSAFQVETEPDTKRHDSRLTVRINVSDQSSNYFIQLIPYFPKCKNDCPRHSDYRLLCPTRGTGRKWPLSQPAVHQTPAKILIVYSQDVCVHHIVLALAELLQEHCQSEVIIDIWQKRRIAEIGPVQWLVTQKEIADKVVFLSSSNTSPECNSACKGIGECPNRNSECMFTLAFNLFCSDWKNQSSLHKYMVVSFNETNSTNPLPSALNICPKYFLMDDIDSFCRDVNLSSEHHESTKSPVEEKIINIRQ